jgi:hypothetical protein
MSIRPKILIKIENGETKVQMEGKADDIVSELTFLLSKSEPLRELMAASLKVAERIQNQETSQKTNKKNDPTAVTKQD